jgi:hypothetical protein
VTETIIPLLSQAVPIIPYLSALLLAIPLAWISLRSRSLFLLRYRFWRLVQSKEAITDPAILKAVQERADLMSFRVLLMRADTPGEALRLASFAQRHGLDVGTLGECGRYFHRHKLAIKERLPDLGRTKGASIGINYLLWMAVFVMTAVAIQSKALVAFKDDGTWFWLGTNSAQLLRDSHGQIFTIADCQKNEGGAGFDAVHSKQVCGIFKDPSLMQNVTETVSSQRWFALTFGFLFLVGLARWRRHLHAVRAAHTVRNWLVFHASNEGAAATPCGPDAEVASG